MAQSALTVTPPNPTPPTNFACTGATPPNPPNYTKNTYANPVANPPPFFDDGTAGTATTFAANTAALASGTGATSGGTEGTYPGTGTGGPNNIGAVPASTSVAHEGAGTETVVTASYPATILNPAGPLQTFSCLGNYTTSPNAQHASSLSPATNPALTSATPGNTAAGGGNTTLAIVGTNFTKQSVVWYGGVSYPTTFTSPTALSVAAVPKKATAGTIPVYVVTGGVVQTATVNATYV